MSNHLGPKRREEQRLPPGPISRIESFKNGDRHVNRVRPSVDVGGRSRPRTLYTYEAGTCSHGEGAFHDCIYVNVRNALIPRALQLAGGTDVVIDEKSHAQRFCEAMSELCGTPGWTK